VGELAWNGGSVFGVMAGWARPALAAAALAVVVSGIALRLAQSRAVAEQGGVLEALALPTPVEEWLAEEQAPTTDDLILTVAGGTSW
jgi:hypothetical protein